MTSNLTKEHPNLSGTQAHGAVWSPWLTVFWGFVLLFIMGLAQKATTDYLIAQRGLSQQYEDVQSSFADSSTRGVNSESSADASAWSELIAGVSKKTERLTAFLAADDLIWPSALASSIIGILAVFIVIVLRKGLNIRDYLNLQNVSVQVWGIWLVSFLALMLLTEYVAMNNEELSSPFMQQVLDGASSPILLLLSIGILVPIFEEMLFRGFIFKGLERGRLGPHGAVWIIALVFALIHMQYAWQIVLMIIPMAALLGYARMYSGSLLVPIVLHAVNNSAALALTMYQTHEGVSF